ncbi:SPW repeat domain-containing protein [Halobiforma nitratireducens]|uniref:SPW repeat-containing integral membrane domain-containing protein n=1 Tax=Halobiforma nitratireducens JCM 10879 TaxID=1227454 RepID=M0LUW0_9EURY|nr:SPW repeat protein [Halobiforma nitratireducens]EMA37357.1 hypothetical protein C446_10900 [Halobiforma nitratireducens JCM 10879]
MSETTDTDRPEAMETGDSESRKWISGIASVVGLWILISPFVLESAEAAVWNNVIVGAAILLLAGYNYYRIVTDHPTSVGVMALAAILGLWTAVAPFAFEIGSETLLWSNVVAGVLGLLLAGYVAYAGRSVRAGAPTGT